MPGGGLRASELSLKALEDKARWVREAAGPRAGGLELNIFIPDAVITTDRRSAATAYLDRIRQRVFDLVLDSEVTVDDLLESPYFLFGTEAEIAEHLRRVREETGVSYFCVTNRLMETFEPVIELLADDRV
jgi:alkanesulfonate monooxygenase SsuD/methylene tetrahydromethanopterin reductase-like flavin-dependent oxidoreductase (luciferase family)